MGKKITIGILLAFMVLGIAIAVANFISVQAYARPCVQVAYQSDPPDCFGTGTTCWDCSSPQV